MTGLIFVTNNDDVVTILIARHRQYSYIFIWEFFDVFDNLSYLIDDIIWSFNDGCEVIDMIYGIHKTLHIYIIIAVIYKIFVIIYKFSF